MAICTLKKPKLSRPDIEESFELPPHFLKDIENNLLIDWALTEGMVRKFECSYLSSYRHGLCENGRGEYRADHKTQSILEIHKFPETNTFDVILLETKVDAVIADQRIRNMNEMHNEYATAEIERIGYARRYPELGLEVTMCLNRGKVQSSKGGVTTGIYQIEIECEQLSDKRYASNFNPDVAQDILADLVDSMRGYIYQKTGILLKPSPSKWHIAQILCEISYQRRPIGPRAKALEIP